jgi:peptidoglycan/xylan/chitin deacetylase (PgdA/CDA1 family)
MNTAALSPTRWTWPALLRASVVLHVAMLVLLMVRPSTWPWLLALLVLNHAVITLAGLWPRADWLGPNLTRLPAAAAARREVALTIDDGPDPELTPAVLDLLDVAGARATFFCIAERAERHPALVAEIVRRGHSVQNHSLRHRHTFSLLGPSGYRRELAAAQAVLGRLAGHMPEFFRAPAGLRNPFLDPVLHALGLTLASWTRRGYDTRERDPQRVLARLLHDLAPGDILLLHDGHAARTSDGKPVVLAVLPTLLARLQAAGLRAVTLPEACRDLPMRRPVLPVPPGPTR